MLVAIVHFPGDIKLFLIKVKMKYSPDYKEVNVNLKSVNTIFPLNMTPSAMPIFWKVPQN